MNTKQQKLLHRSIKLLLSLLMGLFLLGPFSYAAGNFDKDAPMEEHNTAELEKLLESYRKDPEKILKNFDGLKNDNQSTLGKNGKPSQKKLTYSQSIRQFLIPLQSMPEAQLRQVLNESIEKTGSLSVLKKFPFVLNLWVGLIKEKDAIPQLVSIFENQNKLIHFGIAFLFTMILGFVLRMSMRKKDRTIAKAMYYWFLRFVGILILRIFIVIYFFGPQLKPAFQVFVRTLI
jgi:hypothetical protein